jgi:hypothetical protein
MALVVADRVWETTSTSGTGTLTLSGAVSGYQTFAVIGNGNTTYYTITNGTDWEVGIGTYTSSGTTLSRDTVLSSSLGGTKITVTPGSFVFVDYPASRAVYEDESGVVTGYPISGGTINNTTIGATTPSTVNATTITGQTARLNGTGQNLFQQSQTFTNAYWSKFATTVTASATTAPDSTNTASALVEDSSTGTHLIFTTSNPTFPSSVTFTVSIFAKANTRNWLVVNPSTPGVSNNETYFDLTNGVVGNNAAGNTSTITSVGSGWYRCTVTRTATSSQTAIGMIFGLATGNGTNSYTGDGTSGLFIWGAQLELGATANTYISTTTTAVYGTPTLSFSGVSTIGLESNGSLFVQPAGTGALQAQATTSTTAGGNARGARAVDWQTERTAASQVASGSYAVIGGGYSHTANNLGSTISGGYLNTNTSFAGSIGGGQNNTASGGYYAALVGGFTNSSTGSFNFIGGGSNNSGTANAAVTTQSATMNGTTAVTLSGSNANIKVGQLILGTSIASYSYVAAISGTSLTLSQNASGSSTSTLSFFTPHGVVVGGGNNQATGSYSFIGGGGDAGTAANRNVASGDWSFVGGGRNNTASGNGSVICGGGLYAVLSPTTFANVASGNANFIGAGISHTCSGDIAAIVGGQAHTASGARAFVGGGLVNTASGAGSAIMGGQYGTTRGIEGNHVFPACAVPIASTIGISQAALLVLAVQTTDATATALRSNSSAASTTNQVILPNNSAYYFKGSCIANVTGAANGAAWSFEGAIMRGANAASTVLIDTPSVNRVAASSGATAWTIAITADTTNGGLRVTVTGVASTTIRWVAKVETTEVTF